MPLSVADTERAERVLKRSIAKRDAIVAQISLLHDLAHKVENNVEILPLFRARKRDIDTLRTQFLAEQDGIFDLLLQLQREDEYHKIHVPIGEILSDQYYLIIAISDAMQGDLTQIPLAGDRIREGSHIQLPKIKIPSFNGDLLAWISFRDVFKSLVHDNIALSNVEKFHYLLSAITAGAGAVIRSIPLSDSNYEVAWKALEDRFDNKRLIINAHLDKIFSFPPLKSASLNDLKLFLDTLKENIGALQGFNIPNKEGYIMFYIAFRLLDSSTKCQFESQHKTGDLPVIDDLLRFVQTRCNVLENSASSITSLQQNIVKPNLGFKKPSANPRHSLFATSGDSKKGCPLCNGQHYLGKCDSFLRLSSALRLQKIQTLRMCINCLSSSHTVSKCASKYSCRQCKARHHSLLHLDQHKASPVGAFVSEGHIPSTSHSSAEGSASAVVGLVNSSNLNVLGTALIRVRDNAGQWVPVRALLDSGSQISAITHACATRLGLTRRRTNFNVVGLSQSPIAQTKGCVTSIIVPHSVSLPELRCEPVVLPKITGCMPSAVLDPLIRSTYSGVHLADPSFDRPGRIDFLLGADLYNKIFEVGFQVRHTVGLPSAFETILGWIFVGASSPPSTPVSRMCLTISSEPSLKQLLHRFWACEEPVVQPTPFTDNERCEDNFKRTVRRDNTGRYIVSLPFKHDPSGLGDSRNLAMSRFFNLERKLQREPQIYEEYRSFMRDYESLGHMKLAANPGKYLIPHHAVVKNSNGVMKLRVVFDASARSSSGMSLNDTLITGPKLQCDIMDLLIQCRLHKYMFTADICKMYRQIQIQPAHSEYQHILWREDPSLPLVEYSLSTVTYGVASAPYLAIRVLHQLESDEGYNFSGARGVLSTRTYVDDIITGAETVEKTLLLQEQVINLLGKGRFELKKWASNCPSILQRIPVEDQVIKSSFDPKDSSSVKILGLHWDPAIDVFSYHCEPFSSSTTKRSILSAIATIFDPLGILSPITFWSKVFMQALWKSGYDWDQPISEELSVSWNSFSADLPCVSAVSLQRHIPTAQAVKVHLVGFSDASQKGFAAVVYLRLEYASKPPSVHLVTAKSKVSPLKSGKSNDVVSIPKLELCGALLLGQTLHRVQNLLAPTINISEIHAWTDSTVVLSWLTVQQAEFKIFVTNRLKRIAELIPSCQWHYVPSSQNPADCVSRGMFPREALAHTLYWEGPELLRQPVSFWSSSPLRVMQLDQLPERRSNPVGVYLATKPNKDDEWLDRFSTLTRLQRVLVHMIRFIARARTVPAYSGYIRHSECEDAMRILVKISQSTAFRTTLSCLRSSSHELIPRSLARLSPFLDTHGIIRVGGRLRHSSVTEDFKHPMLLPKACTLVQLLVRHYHIQHLHAGPQTVSFLLAARFWIIASRSVIRKAIYNCVTCARHRSIISSPIMGDLPQARICQVRPFSKVGIDYAGPFLIKEGRRRNAKSIKCYLAIFICMAVKAVHIEVVTDLSTSAFIAALHRFVSRRGVPTDIFSDCGTNFKGADTVLQSLFQDPEARRIFANTIPCSWHFNPPAAPHFGGLWEAAVKSTKFHLKRVIGIQTLTFEEMATCTHRIEALLNSRPVMPQSTDPHDLRALTPGDFLIGCPLVAIPEPQVTSTPINRLTRWQLLNQIHQSFWKRWSSEYLTTLQAKSKWYRPQSNLAIGDLVLLRQPNVPPTVWKLGRIVSVHPGEDGVVRVATVRTRDGVYKRPVVKLARLPVDDNSKC